MPFDSKKFMKQEFERRTESVKVPDLKAWFGDDDPVWVVKGLTGVELARVNEAGSKNVLSAQLLEMVMAKSDKETVASLKQQMGLGDDTPADVAKRLELLVSGSVKPEVSLELAVKLAETFPIEFATLTNSVMTLTGKGSIALAKPGTSGKTAT
jgi:hypothetical protein